MQFTKPFWDYSYYVKKIGYKKSNLGEKELNYQGVFWSVTDHVKKTSLSLRLHWEFIKHESHC